MQIALMALCLILLIAGLALLEPAQGSPAEVDYQVIEHILQAVE